MRVVTNVFRIKNPWYCVLNIGKISGEVAEKSAKGSAHTHEKNHAYSKWEKVSVWPPCYKTSDFWACLHAGYTMDLFIWHVATEYDSLCHWGGSLRSSAKVHILHYKTGVYACRWSSKSVHPPFETRMRLPRCPILQFLQKSNKNNLILREADESRRSLIVLHIVGNDS